MQRQGLLWALLWCGGSEEEGEGMGAAGVGGGTGWRCGGPGARAEVAPCAGSAAGLPRRSLRDGGEWCRECSSAQAMSAETRPQEVNSLVLPSCAHASAPSVSCPCVLRGPHSLWPLLGCPWQTSSLSSYFLLSEQGRHSFVFPHSTDQLSVIAVGLLLLMSGNCPRSLSLCFCPFYIYLYMYITPLYLINIVVPLCGMCGWSVPTYTHFLCLVGGDANSSMT